MKNIIFKPAMKPYAVFLLWMLIAGISAGVYFADLSGLGYLMICMMGLFPLGMAAAGFLGGLWNQWKVGTCILYTAASSALLYLVHGWALELSADWVFPAVWAVCGAAGAVCAWGINRRSNDRNA